MKRGPIYLIPCDLGGEDLAAVLPESTLAQTRALRHFVVENAKAARGFLKRVGMPVALAELELKELSEHTPPAEIPALLEPALAGRAIGLISEAGCPAVADPGALLIAAAHAAELQVVPLVGPSSILLGLMASGLNGQSFVFHGYLPAKPAERNLALRAIDETAWKSGATQGFIETPYRNLAMIEALCANCRPQTQLCVAVDLTLATESIRSQPITAWKKANCSEYAKRPAVFFLGRPV